ncbi:MAG: hypothetical protein AAFR75_03810 [Pseudomonadota bacterium]
MAAEEGLGVILEPALICGEGLVNGTLEPVLNEFRFFDMAAYVIFSPSRLLPSHVCYLIKCIVNRFNGTDPWEAWRLKPRSGSVEV